MKNNICCGQECDNRKSYTDIKANFTTQIDCKLGKNYTCCHPKHPDNIAITRAFSVIEAEDEAFEKAGIKEGTVTYTCPICGGEAIANRYMHGDRYHGLGSGCKKCGVYHT